MGANQGKTLTADEQCDWLRLIRSENVGPITFHNLLEQFGTAGAALAALPDLARRGGRASRIKVFPKASAQRELEAAQACGAEMVAICEPGYPPLLAHIENAPPLIFVLGHKSLLGKRCVALVGVRNASISGCRFAWTMAAELGEQGFLVVSGLARGIDTAAHEGALESGTLAVMAGGVDVAYPKENTGLHARIAAQGALVSEVSPGTQPQARHFPRRNRIISGFCRGVVVVEASCNSGSLITARMALEQNREVFAVPGSPTDPRTQGTNDLIRQGAVLVRSADDVAGILRNLMEQPLAERKALDFTPSPALPLDDKQAEQTRILVEGMLNSAPVTVDEIIRASRLPTPFISVALLELELAGRLERHPGGRVSLI